MNSIGLCEDALQFCMSDYGISRVIPTKYSSMTRSIDQELMGTLLPWPYYPLSNTVMGTAFVQSSIYSLEMLRRTVAYLCVCMARLFFSLVWPFCLFALMIIKGLKLHFSCAFHGNAAWRLQDRLLIMSSVRLCVFEGTTKI